MAYEKQVWIDRLETDDEPTQVIRDGNLLEAKRFNHMEDGIAECSLAVESLQTTVGAIESTGYVASVEFIEDEEDKRLVFTLSNGETLSVPIGKQTYQVSYYDGPTLLFKDVVESGKNSTYTTIPTKTSTAQYDFTFLGWSTTEDGDVEEGIQNEISDNLNLYAIYEAEIRSYEITFMNGIQTLQTEILEYGEMPSCDGSDLTNDEGRPFDKWVPELKAVEGPVTYNPSFQHKLTYYDGNNLLKTIYVKDGESPSDDYTPTKANTAQYTYTFSGWTTTKNSTTPTDTALSPMSEDRVLYAIFTATVGAYTVTWDMNGVIETATYNYGQTPVPPTVSAADGRSFSSWDKTIGPVTGDVTYTARYQKRVRFYNGSTLLTTQYVEYGGTATYTGSTPTKASTTTLTYSFSGWSSSSSGSVSSTVLNSITADKDVYAIFNSSTRYYSVKFYNGSTLLQTVNVTYNSNASYTGTTPTKSSTAQYTYSFSGWSSTNGGSASSTILTGITASKSVYAAFSASTRYYDVKFYNGSTLLQTLSVAYNGTASYTGSTPTKASTTTLTYSFSGWASSSSGTASSTILNNITASKSVYAVFTSATRYYSVKFYNGSTLLQTKSVTYNSNASYTGSTPTKTQTAQYTYSFSGWGSSSSGSVSSTILNNITADKSVYAIFSATTRSYTVKFYNDSTLLQTKTVLYGNNVTYTGSTPTKATTAQYTYEFYGWGASASENTVSSTILNNITGDKSVYAKFSQTLRYYYVRFKLQSYSSKYRYLISPTGSPTDISGKSFPYTIVAAYTAYGAMPNCIYKYSSSSTTSYSSATSFNWSPTLTTTTGDNVYYGS